MNTPKMPDMRTLQTQFVKRMLPKGGGFGPIGALAALAALGVIGYNSMYNVDGGHRAVVFNKIFGVKDTVYAEGTHFLIPFIEKPIIYNVRSKPRKVGSPTGSNDLQMVDIRLRVLSRPVITALPTIYRTLGTNYDDRVLPSIVNEVLKSVVAQFTASQLITQREKVSQLIHERLVERAQQFHIILDDVSITDLSFSQEYTNAVESKQVAQQEAERAKFIVEMAEQEKKSVIIRAQGEAAAAKMINQSIKQNANFLVLRRIEAARDIAKVISKGGNKIYLNSDHLLSNIVVDDKHQKTK